MAKRIDGVLQGGAPIVLRPVCRVTKADILAVLSPKGTWMKPSLVRMALSDDKWAYISLANLAVRLRGMADAGEIERCYGANGRAEYKGLAND